MTESATVVDLYVDSLEGPVVTTDAHPFYSLDRRRWVASGDLSLGESVSTRDGSAIVCAIAARSHRETVYNLEISGAHSYYVSPAALWVHNACVNGHGIKPYNALRRDIKGSGLQAHHLIEKRFAQKLGQKEGEMLSVALTREQHQALTNLWRMRIPYGKGTAQATKASIIQAAREIYSTMPPLKKALGL